MAILREFTNKDGVEFDAENTEVLYAEDMNGAGEALDDHEYRVGNLETDLTGKEDAFVAVPQTVVALSDGATPALDASLGDQFNLVAAGNRTIAVPINPTAGQRIIIRHQASGAARTLSLNTGAGGFRFGTDITELTETPQNKTDYIGCIYHIAFQKWDVVAYVKGF